MDPRSVRVLEFPKILDMLAVQAAFSMGKERALGLKPSTDEQWIASRLAETTQARQLLMRHGAPPFGGVTDITELLAGARVGKTLAPEDLLAVSGVMRGCRRLRDYYNQGDEDAVDLFKLGQELGSYPEVEAAIGNAIDEFGQVKPDASPQLRQLYRRQQSLQEQMRGRMEALLAHYTEQGILQDRVIVRREGRWCLPVQTNLQGRFRGIVHDRSDSGATVFMEPLDVLELGNTVREADLAIEAEIERILHELSGRVQLVADAVINDLQVMSILDFITARAHLAQKMNATEPQLDGRNGYVNLNGARHPLLGPGVVPLNLWVGREFHTLVVTGPNTGGKTVCLKTLGLLALMTQSGLHVPAEPGTVMSVFDHIFADIGDEQSIEQSLSTFSSHMTQIVKIISRVRQGTHKSGEALNALVLLDEIGAGTDPSEGAALGQAILTELHESGCRTVATTHYNDLKVFAYATEGMENASVEFNIKTLEPTYKLLIGHPGSSNAFEIAQRLGLPRRLADLARGLMDEEQQTFTQVLSDMEARRGQMVERQMAAARAQRGAEQLRDEYQRDVEELRVRRQKALDESYAEARQIVTEAQEQARAIIADLQAQTKHNAVTEQRREELGRLRREIEERAAELRKQMQPAAEPAKPQLEASEGMWVHVSAFGRDGLVTDLLDEETARIQIGNLRVDVNIADLEPPKEPASLTGSQQAGRMKVLKQMTVAPEIDLRGTTVDEAILDIEKYLDDAALAGLSSVRILHGKGTGALREGISRYLRRHRAVKAFETAPWNEGGDGVTVVTLA